MKKILPLTLILFLVFFSPNNKGFGNTSSVLIDKSLQATAHTTFYPSNYPGYKFDLYYSTQPNSSGQVAIYDVIIHDPNGNLLTNLINGLHISKESDCAYFIFNVIKTVERSFQFIPAQQIAPDDCAQS